MKVYIEAVGIAAPGLDGWQKSKPILAGSDPWLMEPLGNYKPVSLPANERRRATQLVRTVFRVLEDIESQRSINFSGYASVFASSGGDYPVIDKICNSLSESDRLISPTVFHNSVHNSASGYWSIAKESTAPSVCLSAFDYSFPMGLLESCSLCLVEQRPVLFTCYDIVPPEPLQHRRKITSPFGSAFIVTNQPSEFSIAELTVQCGEKNAEIAQSLCTQPLESLRQSNPAAQALPLLVALSDLSAAKIIIDANDTQQVSIEVKPWN